MCRPCKTIVAVLSFLAIRNGRAPSLTPTTRALCNSGTGAILHIRAVAAQAKSQCVILHPSPNCTSGKKGAHPPRLEDERPVMTGVVRVTLRH
ncbi:hypothetical protein COLSTE_00356 [Collinsella stercoris DSM 13279]|uniref:Uncharacterized protein n=1 Tax=Collinsella stercoris DSM 13279 TaxID=445975 RepID=B6G8E8_9ACTN|nr:hypothetical protein COLSTE_00356 [Collinsella stercoris DSM 13279]